MERISANFKTGLRDDPYHITVLTDEVIEGLNVRHGKQYIDATLGGGGHSFEIIQRGGRVLGIDADKDAIEYVNKKFEIRFSQENLLGASNSKFEIGKDLILVHGNFRDLGEIARNAGFTKVAGIIFDLGTSRHQLKTVGRGFSFQSDEELDMRMDKGQVLTAKNVINNLGEKELYEIFTKFGEEKLARSIAHAIVGARYIKPIETTEELAIIVRFIKKTREKTDAATKVFQALRIYINREFENLKEGLVQGEKVLEKDGRMAVISFHSLEDRIVKNFYRNGQNLGEIEVLTKKPITALDVELKQNPSARSAKLRIAIKL